MQLGLACPVCSQLNPMRATACDRCGSALAPAPARPAAAPSPSPLLAPPMAAPSPAAMAAPSPAAMAAPSPAAMAASPLSAPPMAAPAGPRFDAVTGQRLDGPSKPAAKTMFFGALQQQAVIPRLVVIKGEGGDGVTYHLSGTTHIVGRTSGDIRFSEDLFLSPEHALFATQDGKLVVKDMGSANGIFLRIKSPVTLSDGDCFLVGEQLLRLDARPLPNGAPDAEGTYHYSSPRPDGTFRVVQLLAGGGEGRITSARGGSLTIGREGNILNFPTDRFISGRHARLDAASDSNNVFLTDTGSRNGTFVRIKAAQQLVHGDYIFVGQQLLRVEIS